MLKWFRKNKPKLAIWGWWQGKNLGDNWIRSIWLERFPEADYIDTGVLDFKPYRFVICAGGGLFIRDVIPPWNARISIPFGMAGLGAEFKHKDTRASELAAEAEFFFVRDEYSLKCMQLDERYRSYDLTFARPLPWVDRQMEKRCLFIWRDPSVLLSFDDFREYIGPVTNRNQWISKIEKNYTEITVNEFETTKCDIEHMTENIGLVISARYHGVVAAIQRGIPVIGIDVCPKIRALMTECGIEEFCIKYEEVNKLKVLIHKLQENKDLIRQRQKAFRDLASETVNNHFKQIEQTLENFDLKR